MLCKGIISINYEPKIADCQPRAQTRGTDRSTQAGTGKISLLYTPGSRRSAAVYRCENDEIEMPIGLLKPAADRTVFFEISVNRAEASPSRPAAGIPQRARANPWHENWSLLPLSLSVKATPGEVISRAEQRGEGCSHQG